MVGRVMGGGGVVRVTRLRLVTTDAALSAFGSGTGMAKATATLAA